MGFLLNNDVIDISLEVNINAIAKKFVEKNKDLYKLTELLPAIERGIRLGLDEIEQEMYQRLLVATANIDVIVTATAENDSFTISAIGPQAVYLEFGTGIVGSSNPHPNPEFASGVLGGPWKYDINNHGSAGWTYYDENRRPHHTTGIQSMHFMYDVWLWGRQSYSNKIRKHINRELGRL